MTGRALSILQAMTDDPNAKRRVCKETDPVDALRAEVINLRERRNCGRKSVAEILLGLWVLGADMKGWGQPCPHCGQEVALDVKELVSRLPKLARPVRRLVAAKMRTLPKRVT